jgi:predicted CopG family antitoxin
MAEKTITIDLEVYEALRRRKSKGQSFSQVINEHFGAPKTARDLMAALEHLSLNEETLETLERLIKGRSENPSCSVEL